MVRAAVRSCRRVRAPRHAGSDVTARARGRAARRHKMAASSSLDEALCADVDSSAVTAIVGPRDAPLAAPGKAAHTHPLNGSAHGGAGRGAAALGEARPTCGRPGATGPAARAAVGVQAAVGQGAGGAAHQVVETQQHQQQAQQQQQGQQAAAAAAGSSSNTKGALGGRAVLGAAPTPMTGAQGTQVVNGGVSGAGAGAAPQNQLALKGLTKVVTAAGQAGQTAVIMSKPGTVTAQPGVPGVPLPQGMQIINMRPGHTIKTTQGATLAPRMILNPAQVLPAGIRAGQPGVSVPLRLR